jgi:PleD family two-component response regulator
MTSALHRWTSRAHAARYSARAVAEMARPGRFSVESLSSVHALLVDDDRVSREELFRVLRYCGALVTAVDTDADARRVLGILRPDVVVIAVPRRHCGELPLVRHLKQGTDAIPVIAILWPGDTVPDVPTDIVTLRRPIDAWDVCRTLATAVTVN